jgi:hypothetical protein
MASSRRTIIYSVTCWWLDTWVGLVIGFIEHSWIVTTSNYSAIANSRTLQFTTARIKSSMFVFTSRCLVTDPNMSPWAHVVTGWLQVSRLRSSQSQCHVTTDGQLASQSWCQAPSGAQDQIFVTVRHLLFCRCGALPLTTGRVCHLSRSQSAVHDMYIYRFTCRHSTWPFVKRPVRFE